MPRAARVFFDGAVYHVYNKTARGEHVIGEERAAGRFVELLRDVMRRDEVRVLAWCVMSNHYHLAVQTGPIPLDRPMQSVQQRFTRWWNGRNGVFGPLWQGRYRAKLVTDQRYLDRLLAYIHLNPVASGIVEDPREYRWSGHRELLGEVRDPLIDVDEVLRLFGGVRRTARKRYVRYLRGAREEAWTGEEPGRLPWWRRDRTSREENEDPDEAVRERREAEAGRRARDRRTVTLDELVERGAAWLGIEESKLSGRDRGAEVVRARELLASVGVERFGVSVKEMAERLGKHPSTATGWVMRGVRRRREEEGFRERFEELEKFLSS
ncbi:MAG: hypothetical protein GXP47_15385 [Acidobacteria bacterium]|nr:hypothetical protein [Acidobacteriota bacterium]